MKDAAFLIPDWPVPARVRALATTRGGVGTGVSGPENDDVVLHGSTRFCLVGVAS